MRLFESPIEFISRIQAPPFDWSRLQLIRAPFVRSRVIIPTLVGYVYDVKGGSYS